MTTRAFTFLCFILFVPLTLSAQTASKKQKQEWQKLYPKLNSKMARMEEILNYIDRFLGNDNFKPDMLEKTIEFSFLANQSTKNIPEYIPEEERNLFIKALEDTHESGIKLYQAVKENNHKEAKKIFLQLDKIRRKSHSKWAL